MKACVGFDEIVESGKSQVMEFAKIKRGIAERASSQEQATDAFAKQVNMVESMLRQTYAVAARVTRRTEELSEVAEVWSLMSNLCDLTVNTLRELKERYPFCGAPQLYDLALDYKLACDKRHKGALEEMECQKINLPPGLLPEMS